MRQKQERIERKYGKRYIYDNIRMQITKDMNCFHTFLNFKDAIENYMAKINDYWRSKQDRVITLREMNEVSDIATAIMVSAMQNDGKIRKIHHSVSYLAGQLKGFKCPIEAAKTAAELLGVCNRIGGGELDAMYALIEPANAEEEVLSIYCQVTLSDETRQFIADTMYLPPMLVEPNEIKTNHDSAYLTKGFDSVILKRYNHHDMPVRLSGINRCNKIPLSLDTNILEYDEEPKKGWSSLDTEEKVRNFRIYLESSRKVYDLLLESGNRFFIPNKLDKRGRMNMLGYQVNLQSVQYNKALISLANKEIVEGVPTK